VLFEPLGDRGSLDVGARRASSGSVTEGMAACCFTSRVLVMARSSVLAVPFSPGESLVVIRYPHPEMRRFIHPDYGEHDITFA
jgi:hypothetical protein